MIARQWVKSWIVAGNLSCATTAALFHCSILLGSHLDPLPKLRPLKIGQTGEWKVRFAVENGRQLSARLCALRKSPEQARRARVRAERKSKRNNSQVCQRRFNNPVNSPV